MNPVRGTVNTSAALDRESPYVHDNKYTALFVAVDNGELKLLNNSENKVFGAGVKHRAF